MKWELKLMCGVLVAAGAATAHLLHESDVANAKARQNQPAAMSPKPDGLNPAEIDAHIRASIAPPIAPVFSPLPQLKVEMPKPIPILTESAASVLARQEREEAVKRERWADALFAAEMAAIDAEHAAVMAGIEARRTAPAPAPAGVDYSKVKNRYVQEAFAGKPKTESNATTILPTGPGTYITTDGTGYTVLPGGTVIRNSD